MYFLITLITLFFLAILFYVVDRDDKGLAIFIIQLLIGMTLIKLVHMLFYANKGESYCTTAARMIGCTKNEFLNKYLKCYTKYLIKFLAISLS